MSDPKQQCECKRGGGRPLETYCQKILGTLPEDRFCVVIPEPFESDGTAFYAGAPPDNS
jgi:hypothetical protein